MPDGATITLTLPGGQAWALAERSSGWTAPSWGRRG